MNTSEEPPLKLQSSKRSHNSIRHTADSVTLALSTKLRQRTVLAAVHVARPVKQQVCNQVAGKAA